MEKNMSRQDEIAAKAIRKSTLRSIKEKKESRLQQLKHDYEQQVRELNIQYAKDPERLKAKYAAADFAKSEKARKRAEKRIERERKEIELSEKQRKFTSSEEIGSAIIQGLGVAIFIAATAILDTIGIRDGMDFKSLTIVCYSLFGASMLLMYLFSVLSHALTNFVAKQVFDRLSHVFAYLIIGFAYTAYTITKIQGVVGWVLFGIVWALDFTGILFYAIAGNKFGKVNGLLFAISGFVGLIFIKNLFESLSTISFTMLILSGLFYFIGFFFYYARKIKYFHMIGNLIFLLGSVYLFFSLFFL